MKIGFIGTGTISEAVITGMMKAGLKIDEIIVSARSRKTSADLAARYSCVSICEDNQDIINQSDLLFLAVLPQIAEEVITPLTFRADQEVCSLIATIPVEKITAWGGEVARITRAVPLPPVAELNGITVLSGPSEHVEMIFNALGGAIVTKSLREFDAYTVPGSSMGLYFGIQELIADWIKDQGGDRQEARRFIASLFAALSRTAEQSEDSFSVLRSEHSTPGGLNEQMFRVFCGSGGKDALNDAMNAVADRITKARS
jgi:pyrroline-5-carboxylate reductase